MKTFRFADLALFIFLFGLSCSESGREINVEKLQKRSDDLYYAVNEEKPYSGKVVQLYESGQKQTEQTFKNGKLHGPCRIWYENGQKQKECIYKDGKREGIIYFWTADGKQLETGEVTDIDGNTYMTVKIGDQWWMAENLKVTRYRNGDAITKGDYSSYKNDPANCEIYGYLYNWYAIVNSRGLAPKGFHVANDAEWQTLVDYLGGYDVAGGKLKETARWNSPNTGATNESGFSALPGGYCDIHGYFAFIRYNAFFWSSTGSNRSNAWFYSLINTSAKVSRYDDDKQLGFSVRCVRD